MRQHREPQNGKSPTGEHDAVPEGSADDVPDTPDVSDTPDLSDASIRPNTPNNDDPSEHHHHDRDDESAEKGRPSVRAGDEGKAAGSEDKVAESGCWWYVKAG
jgi:hypothetical protein